MVRCWFEYEGILLCCPPKNGGTSFYRTMLGVRDGSDRHVYSMIEEKLLTPPQASRRRDVLHVMAVRDPVERFGSLWRDKCERLDENYPQLHGMTPEELLGHIQTTVVHDAHWMPQHLFDTHPRSRPMNYIEFGEEYSDQHYNTTRPIDLPHELKEAVRERYRLDISLYGEYF